MNKKTTTKLPAGDAEQTEAQGLEYIETLGTKELAEQLNAIKPARVISIYKSSIGHIAWFERAAKKGK